MIDSIFTLLPNSSYLSTRQLVENIQQSFPNNWFYRPVGIEVEITNKCNLKCAGCGQRDEHSRPEDILSTEEYIDAILQAKKAGLFACSITGGETLLYLERVKSIIEHISGEIDIFKLNSNSYRFVTPEITKSVLLQLKKTGFGEKNHYIKPVFVTSIGQQNEDGMPLRNSVNLVSTFYSVFDYEQALCSINSTDKNIQAAHKWLTAFHSLYEEVTGEQFDATKVPTRAFMLNNVPTLERLGLMIKTEVPIKDLIYSFQNQYTSWKCLNTLPESGSDTTSLTPKCVLRPNGDVIACPGYNYVHKLGNIREATFFQILEKANTNPVLQSVFTDGLPGLLNYAEQSNPGISQQKVSLSYGPCDVCQLLTNLITIPSTKVAT